MTQNRRDFIKSSAALTFLTVTSASAQVARRIGIFHSTKINDQEMACFMHGLGSSANWTPSTVKKGEAYGAYGGSRGRRVLHRYIDGNVDVIVAAGGVTSQMAALEALPHLPIPFVYMSGRAANPPSSTANGKYCGVILNVFAQYTNALNNTNFTSVGIQGKGDVLLIQNYNADMTPDELKEWGYNYPSFRFFESAVPINNPDPDADNSANIQAAFDKEWVRFSRLNLPRPKGVIVNPDPYFRQTASDFIAALKRALPNIPVCYPFSDYSLSGSDFLLPSAPTLSSSTATDPNTAYYQLGMRVNAVLNGLSMGNPIPPNPIHSRIWNGQQWADA
jgi:hypothetical protein